jgi:hypothetical protein
MICPLLVGLILGANAKAQTNGPAVPIKQDSVSALRWIADRSDQLLGGTRTDDNRSRSTLRLGARDHVSHDQPSDPRFHARFALKVGILERWQNEAHAWFKNLWHRSHHSNEDADAAKVSPKEKSTAEPPKDPWRFTFDKHLAIHRKPDARAHARVSKDYETAHLLHSFSAQAGWGLRSKWQAFSNYSISRHLGTRWLAGFNNGVQWHISEKLVTTSHGPGLSFLPDRNQIVNFSAGLATGAAHGNWSAQGYSVAALYRRVWREWIFLEVNTSLGFARTQRFRGDPGVGAALEVVF